MLGLVLVSCPPAPSVSAGPKVLVFCDLLYLCGGLLRIPLLRGLAGVCGEVELPEWILPIIGEEWRHAGCL